MILSQIIDIGEDFKSVMSPQLYIYSLNVRKQIEIGAVG